MQRMDDFNHIPPSLRGVWVWGEKREKGKKDRKGKAETSWGLACTLLGPLSAASPAPSSPFVLWMLMDLSGRLEATATNLESLLYTEHGVIFP